MWAIRYPSFCSDCSPSPLSAASSSRALAERAFDARDRPGTVDAVTIHFAVTFLVASLLLACTPTQPSPAVNRWSISALVAPGGPRAGEDVRVLVTYRPWSSRPVPNRVDFTAVCVDCPDAKGPPEERSITGFFLLTPEMCSDASSRRGPGAESSVCWSVPMKFPYAGRWLFTSPLDVTLEVLPGR